VKVVFIYLPHPYLNQPNSQIPLGLLYLAAVLESHGIAVDVKNYSTFLTHEAINDLSQADVYGITCTSMELFQANRFAHLIKEKYSKAKIGLGGPGTYTDNLIDWNVVDFICKGEAENILLDILKDIETDNLKPIYTGIPVKNLDSLPLPAYHLLKDNLGGNVFAYNKNYLDGGSIVIMTSRGCPYRCAFCANPHLTRMGGAVRYRSADSIYDEMKYIMKTYGIRQFRISDDLFSVNMKRVVEICSRIKSLDVIWRVSARTKPFNKEMAQTMYDAGCREASFGVESFDNVVLKLLNKGTTAEDNYKGLSAAHEAGLVARALFMIRTPGQTSETVDKNIYWLEKTPFNLASCTMFTPMPGSDIWTNPKKYGITILSKDLDKYNFYFFGSHGQREIQNIVELKGRDIDEVNSESSRFVNYLKNRNRLNMG